MFASNPTSQRNGKSYNMFKFYIYSLRTIFMMSQQICLQVSQHEQEYQPNVAKSENNYYCITIILHVPSQNH